jgi:hypothetical protein
MFPANHRGGASCVTASFRHVAFPLNFAYEIAAPSHCFFPTSAFPRTRENKLLKGATGCV